VLAVRALASRELVVVLVGFGILLRGVQYAANRSLWLDEAGLALNVIQRSIIGLLHPLSYGQAAPPAFLLAEGIAAKTLGYSEYILRLFPLVCGIASIPAFAWLARRALGPAAASFALLLFVVAGDLVYYSSELKPYETDVAAAVGLFALGELLLDRGRAWRPLTALAVTLCGLALIAFSFPATFVVASVALSVAGRTALGSTRQSLRSAPMVVATVWLLASGSVALLATADVRLVRRSFELASGRFLGVAGSSPVHVTNVAGSDATAAIGFPTHHPFSQIAKLVLLCALIGAVALLWRKSAQLVMLALPFPLVLAAAALHAYPISQRTILFLVPGVILFIAEGLAQVVRWTPPRARIGVAVVLGTAMALGPVSLAATRLAHPRMHEEIKPVLEFVRDHWHRGDTLYVHYGAEQALLYYEECKCLHLSAARGRQLWPLRPIRATHQFDPPARSESRDVILGRYFGTDEPRYLDDLERVATRRRVWFLYTHANSSRELTFIETRLVGYLNSVGRRIAGIDRSDAHAYLYDINRTK
jgi:hypothetical protein